MTLHRTTVTKVETGTRHITPEVLRKWCELCHVDYELYQAAARLAWVAEASPVPVWFEDFFRAQSLVEVALRGISTPLAVTEWRRLPAKVRQALPTAEDLTATMTRTVREIESFAVVA